MDRSYGEEACQYLGGEEGGPEEEQIENEEDLDNSNME